MEDTNNDMPKCTICLGDYDPDKDTYDWIPGGLECCKSSVHLHCFAKWRFGKDCDRGESENYRRTLRCHLCSRYIPAVYFWSKVYNAVRNYACDSSVMHTLQLPTSLKEVENQAPEDFITVKKKPDELAEDYLKVQSEEMNKMLEFSECMEMDAFEEGEIEFTENYNSARDGRFKNIPPLGYSISPRILYEAKMEAEALARRNIEMEADPTTDAVAEEVDAGVLTTNSPASPSAGPSGIPVITISGDDDDDDDDDEDDGDDDGGSGEDDGTTISTSSPTASTSSPTASTSGTTPTLVAAEHPVTTRLPPLTPLHLLPTASTSGTTPTLVAAEHPHPLEIAGRGQKRPLRMTIKQVVLVDRMPESKKESNDDIWKSLELKRSQSDASTASTSSIDDDGVFVGPPSKKRKMGVRTAPVKTRPDRTTGQLRLLEEERMVVKETIKKSAKVLTSCADRAEKLHRDYVSALMGLRSKQFKAVKSLEEALKSGDKLMETYSDLELTSNADKLSRSQVRRGWAKAREELKRRISVGKSNNKRTGREIIESRSRHDTCKKSTGRIIFMPMKF